MSNDITQDELHRLISYDSESGLFFSIDAAGNRLREIGHRNDRGYIRVCLKGKCYRAHRLAWLYMYGKWPNQIDHANGIYSDNRIVNLRNVTNRQNARNQCIPTNNTSGVRGVRWDKGADKWRAEIMNNEGKVEFLGKFKEKSLAVKARKDAEKRLGYHKNHGNRKSPRLDPTMGPLTNNAGKLINPGAANA